jgi:hypothetical protein
MQVVVPTIVSRGKIDEQEVAAIAGHDASVPRVPGARRRIRDRFNGEVAAGASLADEELDEVKVHACASGAGFEGEAEEHEVLRRGDDAGLQDVLAADLGVVDAAVGDGRRIHEAK